jgi:hypothetical protein
MTRRDCPPAAIEGSEILIAAQKISPRGDPILIMDNRMVFPLKASIRAVGTITRESNPKVAQIRDYSDLNLGDEVSGRILWGFSSLPLQRGDIRIGEEGRTSSHSGQDATINGNLCFLTIVSGWRGTPLLVHPQTELLTSS